MSKKKICIWVRDFFSLRDFFSTELINLIIKDNSTEYIFLTNNSIHRNYLESLNCQHIRYFPVHFLKDNQNDEDLNGLYYALKGRFAEVKRLPHNKIYRNFSESLQKQYRYFLLFRHGMDLIQDKPACPKTFDELFERRLHTAEFIEPGLISLLSGLQPDLMLVCRTHSSETMYFCKAAAMLNIPVAGIVSSWDHPTTHGPVGPGINYLLCASQQIKDEMVQYENFNEDDITLAGKIQMDVFAQPETYQTKDNFLKSLGLTSQKQLITLATNAKGLSRHERQIASFLAKEIKNGTFPNSSLCIRCHPFDEECMQDFGHLVEEGLIVISQAQNYFTNPADKTDQVFLANLMKHSSIVIQSRGSIALDAIALDTPVISLAFELETDIHDGDRIIHEYNYAHYREIADSKATWMAYSSDELLEAIKSYLEKPELHSEDRDNIKERYIGPVDGKAAERTMLWLHACLKATQKPSYPEKAQKVFNDYYNQNKGLIAQGADYIHQLECSWINFHRLAHKNKCISAELIKHLWQPLNQYQKLILFGAGKHTMKLLDIIQPDNVVAILDQNPKKQSIMGIPIITMEQVSRLNPDAVVLSTDCHFKDMENQIVKHYMHKFPIFNIYEDVMHLLPLS